MVISELEQFKKLSERKTISDSKRAFHKAFPHVISPIYRRIADELLVELHLLSHQKNFEPDALFAIGLNSAFETFTKGYKPKDHVDKLFKAICSSNGFDSNNLKQIARKVTDSVKDKSSKELASWLKEKGNGAPEIINDLITSIKQKEIYYSRLTALGIKELLDSANNVEKEDTDELLGSICKELGFKEDRVGKDMSLYKANQEKLNQAIELMNEIIESEKRKRNREDEDISTTVKSNGKTNVEENID